MVMIAQYANYIARIGTQAYQVSRKVNSAEKWLRTILLEPGDRSTAVQSRIQGRVPTDQIATRSPFSIYSDPTKTPDLPANEAARVASLHDLNTLAIAAEERFDRLTRLARKMFNVPIAVVNLVDSNRGSSSYCANRQQREGKPCAGCDDCPLDRRSNLKIGAPSLARFVSVHRQLEPPHVGSDEWPV